MYGYTKPLFTATQSEPVREAQKNGLGSTRLVNKREIIRMDGQKYCPDLSMFQHYVPEPLSNESLSWYVNYVVIPYVNGCFVEPFFWIPSLH